MNWTFRITLVLPWSNLYFLGYGTICTEKTPKTWQKFSSTSKYVSWFKATDEWQKLKVSMDFSQEVMANTIIFCNFSENQKILTTGVGYIWESAIFFPPVLGSPKLLDRFWGSLKILDRYWGILLHSATVLHLLFLIRSTFTGLFDC